MRRTCMALLMAAGTLAGCAPSPHQCVAAEKADQTGFQQCDPGESINQSLFKFNLMTDKYVAREVAHEYHALPHEVRVTIDNFLTNLSEPSNFVNSFLQGDMQAAGTTLWRFILNSTFGFAGLRDFAGENGLAYNEQNFGRTLGTYGVEDGAYVVVPLYGPSTTRDAVGKGVDWFLDPVGWYLTTPENIAQSATDAVDTRDENDATIEMLYYESLDPYSATRAAYFQHLDMLESQPPAPEPPPASGPAVVRY